MVICCKTYCYIKLRLLSKNTNTNGLNFWFTCIQESKNLLWYFVPGTNDCASLRYKCVYTLTHIEHGEELKAAQQAALHDSLSCNFHCYVSLHSGVAFPCWCLPSSAVSGRAAWARVASPTGWELLLTHTQSAVQRGSWCCTAHTNSIFRDTTATWSETMWRKIQHITAVFSF